MPPAIGHRLTGTTHVCLRKAFSLLIYRVMPWTLNHTQSALKHPISSPKHTSFCPEQWTHLIFALKHTWFSHEILGSLPWNARFAAVKHLVLPYWNTWFCHVQTPGSVPRSETHLVMPWNFKTPDSALKRPWFCSETHLILPWVKRTPDYSTKCTWLP